MPILAALNALKLGSLPEFMVLELVIAPMGFQLLLTLLFSDPETTAAY